MLARFVDLNMSNSVAFAHNYAVSHPFRAVFGHVWISQHRFAKTGRVSHLILTVQY